jgi:hypothetical protein
MMYIKWYAVLVSMNVSNNNNYHNMPKIKSI